MPKRLFVQIQLYCLLQVRLGRVLSGCLLQFCSRSRCFKASVSQGLHIVFGQICPDKEWLVGNLRTSYYASQALLAVVISMLWEDLTIEIV